MVLLNLGIYSIECACSFSKCCIDLASRNINATEPILQKSFAPTLTCLYNTQCGGHPGLKKCKSLAVDETC